MSSLQRGMRITAAISVVGLAASPVAARDYYYFNKPGVTREAYVADVAECAELAEGARSDSTLSTSAYVPQNRYTPYALGIASFFLVFAQGADRRRLMNSVERTCMADKGYRRMEVDKKLVREIEGIKDERARTDRLSSLAGSAEPVGRRMAE